LRVLLDECIDQRLARFLIGHEVQTVPEVGWAKVADGVLLYSAQNDFDALVTVDRNLPFQQNLAKYDLAVIVLRAKTNRLADLLPLVPELLRVLPLAPKRVATTVGN